MAPGVGADGRSPIRPWMSRGTHGRALVGASVASVAVALPLAMAVKNPHESEDWVFVAGLGGALSVASAFATDADTTTAQGLVGVSVPTLFLNASIFFAVANGEASRREPSALFALGSVLSVGAGIAVTSLIYPRHPPTGRVSLANSGAIALGTVGLSAWMGRDLDAWGDATSGAPAVLAATLPVLGWGLGYGLWPQLPATQAETLLIDAGTTLGFFAGHALGGRDGSRARMRRGAMVGALIGTTVTTVALALLTRGRSVD